VSHAIQSSRTREGRKNLIQGQRIYNIDYRDG
jgi:hypothetical protein